MTIKVAIGGIHYPLSMMTYFIRALKRREDVELWMFGPFTGSSIPWGGGMSINPKYVVTPDFPLPQSAIGTQVPAALINAQMPWTPDLTLLVDAGWRTKDRPQGGIVVHVQTDPHVLSAQYEVPRAYSDISFCMQTPYMKGNDRYLPYAFDPTVHYPMPEVEKVHDACLIGLLYQHRETLIKRLSSRGLNVYYNIGEIFDEYRMRYNQSRIALSWSSLLDLPARVFEAMGMGLPLVANRVPDMANWFVDGEHYLGFDTTEEAEAQVLRLMVDEDLRHTIADNAHRKVTAQRHTWDERISDILTQCKLV